MAVQLVKETNYDILSDFYAQISGTDFDDLIPEDVRTNIAEVGNAILNYQALKEYFYNAFIVKIALQLFNSFVANNKFAFLKGQMVSGDIEDAYVEYIEGMAFDPTGADALTLKKSDIKTLYHRMDRELMYKVSVSDTQLRGAFLSEGGLSNLINRVIATLYQSKEHDEYVMGKELLNHNFTHAGKVITISGATAHEKATNLLYHLKRISQDLDFVSDEFNDLDVKNSTPLSEQILFLHKDYKLAIDMGDLANVFNLEKLELQSRVITLDDFSTNGNNVIAVIADRRGFRLHDQEVNMETQRNSAGRFTNYFLFVKQLMSYAYFMNLVYFVDGETDYSLTVEETMTFADDIATVTDALLNGAYIALGNGANKAKLYVDNVLMMTGDLTENTVGVFHITNSPATLIIEDDTFTTTTLAVITDGSHDIRIVYYKEEA